MNQSFSFIQKSIKTNPITFMGLVCLMLCTLFAQGTTHFFTPFAPYLLGIAAVIAVLLALPSPTEVGIGLLAVSAFGCGVLLLYDSSSPAVTLLLLGSVALLIIFLYLWLTKQLTLPKAVLLFMAMGFLLRLCYVLYTPVTLRQHDVWSFSGGDFQDFTYQRHGEYIEYIATYLTLPEVDPTEIGLSQLYHPPLHHLIAGLWLRLNTVLGFSYATACENIQLLTLFYSSACMVIGYRILRLIGCKGWTLLIPMAIVCFHPTFILMAGSVNNDLLSITLALYAIYATLRWVKEPTLYNILCIAFGIGCSMMTKLSGGLVAPAIAVVFLWKWIKSFKEGKGVSLFYQFLIFGIICIPLGLWWPVKNAITYDMPLTFVPALSENSGQYLGQYTAAQRLFGLEPDSFDRIFMAWNHSGYTKYDEYNMLLSLLKTSVFGEFTLFNEVANPTNAVHVAGTMVSKILFWANGCLIGVSLFAGGYVAVKQRNKPWVWLLLTVWVTMLFSYIQFCFAYPQACTGNFRYAVPTLLCGCGFLGVYAKDRPGWLKKTLAVITGVFCAASFGCYALLGLV